MMNKFHASLIAGTFCFAVGIIAICDTVTENKRNEIPNCAEDELIQGSGDFIDGKWDSYVCVHPDNL
jgi:hypothetical protein